MEIIKKGAASAFISLVVLFLLSSTSCKKEKPVAPSNYKNQNPLIPKDKNTKSENDNKKQASVESKDKKEGSDNGKKPAFTELKDKNTKSENDKKQDAAESKEKNLASDNEVKQNAAELQDPTEHAIEPNPDPRGTIPDQTADSKQSIEVKNLEQQLAITENLHEAIKNFTVGIKKTDKDELNRAAKAVANIRIKSRAPEDIRLAQQLKDLLNKINPLTEVAPENQNDLKGAQEIDIDPTKGITGMVSAVLAVGSRAVKEGVSQTEKDEASALVATLRAQLEAARKGAPTQSLPPPTRENPTYQKNY